MRRTLLVGMVLMLSLVFTAFAQPNPGCCGSKGCQMSAGCDGPKGCQMGPGCEGHGKMGMEMRHEGMMMGRRGMMRDGQRETIRGRVASIEHDGPGGMKLMVESDSRVTPVIIGQGRPMEFKEDLERNDRVEITGMRVMRGGQPVLMAGKISVEDDGQIITMKRPDRPGRPDRPHRMEMRKKMHPRAY